LLNVAVPHRMVLEADKGISVSLACSPLPSWVRGNIKSKLGLEQRITKYWSLGPDILVRII
jgi:hypothetical protein